MPERHSISTCPSLNGRRAPGATPTAFIPALQDWVTGMYQVRNNRRLARQLTAYVCARPAVIVDLRDAAAFIDMHGVRTPLWITAETAVKCADRNPFLIDQATGTLETALRREGHVRLAALWPCDRFNAASAGSLSPLSASCCRSDLP
jgi:hypothetical protein